MAPSAGPVPSRVAWPSLAAVVLAAACSAAVPDADAGLDAAPVDATDHDAGTDAPDAGPPIDAGRSLVDPSRPYGYRTLHPACGAWAYDLDDASTYDTTGELAVAMMDARCRRAVRCGEGRSSVCDPLVVQPPAEALHAPPDPGDARACLEALGAADCTDAARDAAEASCARLSRYGAPDGSACSADRGCRSHHCDGASAACGGTCMPAPTCSAPCGPDEGCVAGACAPLPAEGEPCWTTPACASGLVCDAGRCTRAQQPGDPCARSEPFPGAFVYTCIALDLGCDPITHLCTAPREVGVGQPCDSLLTRCAPALDCIDGLCAERPGLGMPCRPADRVCSSGLGCSGGGLCAPLVGPGCACDDASACPWSFRCASGVCTRISIAPTLCTSFLDCDGAPCTGGACDVVRLGHACAQDGPSCVEGHCRPLVRGICTATVPSGASCVEDPYGCGSGETCVAWRTCGVPADQQNACAPGWP